MKLIKELDHYMKLREEINQFAPSQEPDAIEAAQEYRVYKATGPNTEKVYYGYVKGNSDAAIKAEFFGRTKGGESSNPEDEKRGINMLINANGGTEGIEFEELAVVDTEEHAFALRNEEREADPESVTGPSAFPVIVNRKAMSAHPEIYARQMIKRELNKCKTAREAWAKKFFDTKKIKALQVDRNEFMKDLDSMNPFSFSKKYNLPIETPVAA